MSPSSSGAINCALSLIIQLAPIVIGPSVEFILLRGWSAVFAPMVMGWVPEKDIASVRRAEESIVSGGRGAEGAEAAERCFGAIYSIVAIDRCV